MSYYQGDYYQGDYYQGDPFLGALIGMGATWLGKKLLGKAAPKLIAGTVGAAAGTGIVTGAAAGMAAGPIWTGARKIGEFLVPRVGSMFTRGPSQAMAPAQAAGPAGCGCESGFHLNKSIGRGRATMGMPPGSYCVRNRAMNVANPRALRRGLRRVVGFGKLAARTRKSLKAAARAV